MGIRPPPRKQAECIPDGRQRGAQIEHGRAMRERGDLVASPLAY